MTGVSFSFLCVFIQHRIRKVGEMLFVRKLAQSVVAQIGAKLGERATFK
jgi:hypothetical protein